MIHNSFPLFNLSRFDDARELMKEHIMAFEHKFNGIRYNYLEKHIKIQSNKIKQNKELIDA